MTNAMKTETKHAAGYERVKKSRARNTDRNRNGCRAWRQKLRGEAFSQYGEKCCFCGEDRPECLTIDHIENDGKAHRASLYSYRTAGHAFYSRLRKLGWPKDGLQVLCWNCNMGKKVNGGITPPLRRAGSAVNACAGMEDPAKALEEARIALRAIRLEAAQAVEMRRPMSVGNIIERAGDALRALGG